MNVRHTLICFFFLSGNTGLITEGIPIITGKEGGNIRHECRFIFSGSGRALYKEDNILFETQKHRAHYDRYSIEYESGIIITDSVLYVSITNLIKSDSGKYKCVLKRDYFPDSVEEFELRVKDAPNTLKPNWTPGPFPTSVPSTSTPPTTQSLISSSGSSTPSSVSPKTTQSQEKQTAAGQAGNTGLITAEIPIIPVKEGGNIRHECKFIFSGCLKALDKEGHSKEKDKAHHGRCRIKFSPEPIFLYVSITNLMVSDSGKYRCVLNPLHSTDTFELRVEDAGNTGLINAEIPIITGKEGGNIKHECKFIFSGSLKALYKEDNILIETEKDKDQHGRYSIEFSPEPISLYASIRNLMESDSVLYRCNLDPLHSTDTFELRVEGAPPTLTSNWTPASFPTSVPSTSTQTALQAPAGRPVPSTSTQTGVQTPQARGIELFVCLILVTVVLLSLIAAVLLYCRKTASKPKGPPQETEYDNVTEADPVYEEIREEDRWSRYPPVEISTIYTYGMDNYSFVTAAQKETEDNWRKRAFRKDQRLRKLVAGLCCGEREWGAAVGYRGRVYTC